MQVARGGYGEHYIHEYPASLASVAKKDAQEQKQ